MVGVVNMLAQQQQAKCTAYCHCHHLLGICHLETILAHKPENSKTSSGIK
jgi:hypothetical protein